jgi:hypothetical protein
MPSIDEHIKEFTGVSTAKVLAGEYMSTETYNLSHGTVWEI